jgi:hypothetical protein
MAPRGGGRPSEAKKMQLLRAKPLGVFLRLVESRCDDGVDVLGPVNAIRDQFGQPEDPCMLAERRLQDL